MNTNQLYILADEAMKSGDYQTAAIYYNQLLDVDPMNWRSLFYSEYCAAANCRIFQIASAAKNLNTRLATVAKVINRLTPNDKSSAMIEVMLRVQALSTTLEKSARQQLYRSCQGLYDTSYNMNAADEYLQQQWAISELLTLAGSLGEVVCPGDAAVARQALAVYQLAAQYYSDFRWMGGASVANSDQAWDKSLFSKIRKHKPGYRLPTANVQGFPDVIIHVMTQNAKKYGHLVSISASPASSGAKSTHKPSHTPSSTNSARKPTYTATSAPVRKETTTRTEERSGNKPAERKPSVGEEKYKELAAARERIRPFKGLLAAGISDTACLCADGTVMTSNSKFSVDNWKDICAISAGGFHCLGLKGNGEVVAAGSSACGIFRASRWEQITTICASQHHSVGLKSNGTVVAAGWDEFDQCKVDRWYNIAAICASSTHTVGLLKDGRVSATGANNKGQCEVLDWKNITAIQAGHLYTVGLKANGTVVATGENSHGQCNVAGWHNIVAISAVSTHTVGLRADGTVVAVGENSHGQCNVAGWNNIVDIVAGDISTVGLKADGTVVACGGDHPNQCAVSQWRDIVAVSAGGHHTIGLKSDGTIVAVGDNQHGQCNMNGKTLFRKGEDVVQMARWRKQGRCQYCGGSLKGLFGKKCVDCMRPKDY